MEDSQAVDLPLNEAELPKLPTQPAAKPKKVLTEKQLDILAKARVKAAETRKAKAEQKAKDTGLQEELKKLEAQKLVAQVAEARKQVQENAESKKPAATPAPKQDPLPPQPKEAIKEEKPFVPTKKAVQKRNARQHVEEPVPIPRRRLASYDRGHWDDHARSGRPTAVPDQSPLDIQRAAAADKRARYIAKSIYGI